MTTSLAIERAISGFSELHDRLGLQRASEDTFSPQWQNLVAKPSESDRTFLDRLQQRYRYYYDANLLTEGTVLLAIVAPLLEYLGFHEPPFFVRSEVPVRLEIRDREEVYRGRIDALVVRDRLWVLTVEAKRSKFAVDIALPQCLAYMAASGQETSFGMATNGSDFVFYKLAGTTYDFSEPFSLLSRQNRLYDVAEFLSGLKESLK